MRLYYVYILSNTYRTVLYVGFTNNLPRRIREHRSGVGSIFTSRYQVHDLLYFEAFADPVSGIYREKVIKKWGRRKKLRLIHSANPTLRDLTADVHAWGPY